MPKCEFSEDEYEIKLIRELCDFYGTHFDFYKPSRRREKDLGFDFAITTYYSKLFNENDIWLDSIEKILGLPFNLPLRLVSSFIQTKIPFFVSQRSSQNPTQWDQWNTSFYRIDISNRNQLKKLSQLEKRLKGDALVRYAAPCFHTYREFDINFHSNMLNQKTHFQSPSSLLTKQKHDSYTYTNPNKGGIAFSEPESINTSNYLEELFSYKAERGDSNIFKHIENLHTRFLSSETIFDFEKRDYNKLSKEILGEFYDFEIPFMENMVVGKNFAKALEIQYTCRNLNLNWVVF